MKLIHTFILPFALLSLIRCNYKSDHPQADILKDQPATGMNEVSIRRFTDSLNRSILTYNKQFSLIYMLGDHTLYVERYAATPKNKVYYERTTSGNVSNVLKKYYFKNDSLILVEVNSRQNLENSTVFKDSRIYFRNNTIFKKEERSAASLKAIQAAAYVIAENTGEPVNEDNYLENVTLLDDAIQQRNKFDLVFDNITTYPDAQYLILKSKAQNGYTASIRIESRNNFIDSLLKNPATYKDEKLKFKWTVSNNEAVYVPEGASITSASGLNK